MTRIPSCSLWSALVVSILVRPTCGSDHADPIKLKRLEAGLTGLFVFPSDQERKLVVVLGVRRALTQAPPYELEPYTYSIYFDLHSAVAFDSEEDRMRYGGTVITPEDIGADAAIEFRLHNDATLRDQSIQGLADPGEIRIWAGVRDDPFIFPRFFGTNIVAMVASIPFPSFPDGQRDWLVWATSRRGEKQLDHVGRSLRTMLPRFDFLNTLPPHEHVAALQAAHEDPGLLRDIARNEIMPLFALRQYDFVPDVMVFTRRFPIGYPNGRLLTDDVAALACQQGDCLLWELSFADSEQWPRGTTNDKPFLDEFPYLAEPWPVRAPAPMPGLTTKNRILLVVLVIAIVLLFVLPWLLYVRCRRRLSRVET